MNDQIQTDNRQTIPVEGKAVGSEFYGSTADKVIARNELVRILSDQRKAEGELNASIVGGGGEDRNIADILLSLPDAFGRGITFPLDVSDEPVKDAVYDTAEEIITDMARLNGLKDFSFGIATLWEDLKIKLGRRDVLLKEVEGVRYKEMPHNLTLAARIAGHDLNNVLMIPHGYAQMLGNSNKSDYDPKFMDKVLLGMEQVKAFCSAMCYLATGGDEKFLSQMPASQIEHMVRKEIIGHSGSEVKYEVDEGLEMSNIGYVLIAQLKKNVEGHCTHHCINADITIRVEDAGDYVRMSLQDNGQGIVNVLGTRGDELNFVVTEYEPMPADEISQIFRADYTTGGTGLGLGLVDALTRMLGGHYEVTTTIEGNPTLRYDSRTGECKPIDEQLSRGTTFAFYLPKKAGIEEKMVIDKPAEAVLSK